jgi:hypothetical protein
LCPARVAKLSDSSRLLSYIAVSTTTIEGSRVGLRRGMLGDAAERRVAGLLMLAVATRALRVVQRLRVATDWRYG